MLTSNTKRFVMLLLVLLQVFSSVFFVPGIESYGGSVFRVLLTAFSIYLVISYGLRLTSMSAKKAIYACVILALWMLISIAQSHNVRLGIQQVSYIFTISLLIYTFDYLVQTEQDMRFLAKSIVFVGWIVTAFSVHELLTGNHLFHSQLLTISESDASLAYVAQDTAWFTFSNPNDLGVHLVFCSISAFFAMRSRRDFALYAFSSIFFVYLSFELDSRLALIAFAVFLLVFVVCNIQGNSLKIFAASVSASIIGLAFVLAALIYVDDAEFLDVSTFVRLKLLASAITMASESLFFGTGVGNFEADMWSGGWTAMTYGIVNPHNAMGRLLAENGIIGLLLFGFLLFGPLLIIMRAQHSSRTGALTAAFVTSLPLLLSVGSDPLSASTLQLAIAVCWAFSRQSGTKLFDQHRRPVPASKTTQPHRA